MSKLAPTLELLNFLDPSEETAFVYQSAFEFAAKEIAPLNARMAKNNAFPKEVWKLLADAGYLGMGAPVAYGGSAASFLQQVAVTAAISYHSPSVALSFLAHNDLALGRIMKWGTEEQKQTYGQACIIEGKPAALAMSEPEAGSDVMSMRTHAVAHGDGFILNGTKTWITNGGDAHVTVVYAKTNQHKPNKLTAFLVEKDTPGFLPVSKIDKNGMRGSETYELTFNDCYLPKTQVLGEVDQGARILIDGLSSERIVLSAAALDLGQFVFDKSCEYVQQRHQFGAPIGANQAVAFDIATMGSELTSLRNDVYLAAAMHDKGVSLTPEKAASVFLQAGKIVPNVTLKAVELFGGNGLTEDYPISQYHNDSHLYMTGGGSMNIRKEILARHYLPAYDQEQRMVRDARKARGNQPQ